MIKKLPSRRRFRFLVYVQPLLLLLFGLFIATLALESGHGLSLVLGFLVGLAAALAGAAAIVLVARRELLTKITEDALHFIPFVHGWTIPLSEIAGLGLLFQTYGGGQGAALHGWYLTVWDGAGTAHQLPQFVVAAKGRRAIRPDPTDTGPNMPNLMGLSYTWPGEVAEQIYDAVVRVQGTGGPLAKRHLHRERPRNGKHTARIVGYWSPDGSTGRYPRAT